jgi:hypothetical protein
MLGVVATIVALETYSIFSWKIISIISGWYLLLSIMLFISILKLIFSTNKTVDYSNSITP